MNGSGSREDRPIELNEGVNLRRERLWGVTGGVVGALVGVTSALIAVYGEGASWRSSGSPYPKFFEQTRLLVYDRFLFCMLAAGAAFLVASIVLARVSRHPRTDSMGASLIGMVLTVLAGVLLFTRLVAIAGAH